MTSMIASTEDLNVLLSSFTRRIANISSATLCQIALLTQSGPALKIKSAHMARKADWKPQIGKVYPLGKVPVCRQVIDTRQPIILHRDHIERLTNDTDTMELLTGGLKDLHSIHIIPMMTKGRILGIIILGKARGFKRSFFTSTKTLLIQALAKQAATAFDHVRLIEETKKTSFSLLEAALDSTADGILVINRTGKVTNFNAQFSGMWTIPSNVLETCEHDAVLGYVMNQLRRPEQFLDKIKEVNSQPEIQTYDAIECKDGRIYECFSQPQRVDAEIVGRVWSFRDITERRKAEEALENQAIRDPLTELYNRRYFETRMKEEIARADRSQYTVAILLCDIDQFKAVNDSRGHQFGDEILKTVAQRLRESTRGADLVFRWGGDEMVVVLANSNRQGLLIVGERIRKAIQTLSEQLHINLDVSIGVALYPEHGRTVDELIRLADRALYIAKKGGDKIHIGEEEYQLDEQTIKVVFQPVVDVRSNEVMGYEALSRDAKGK
ncbi:MAG: diguanylate cyclase, partial [Nitrospira sp.]|nr:diguanylate cyclase [Nitrospira sp.]